MKTSFQISSIQENIHQVEAFCRKFLEKLDVDEDKLNTSLIIITELVNNAIIHGNQSDPNKSVQIHLDFNKQENVLNCTIIDDGPGYKDQVLSDPTDSANLLKSSGRGIYIVKHYASSFQHYVKNNKHITEVELDLS